MSVYVRPDAKDNVYSYDFRIRGRRFSGSTGKTSRREAEQVEKSERERAKLEIAAEAAVNSAEMTVRAALARYWSEVGQHHANADNTLRALTWLETHFGPNTPLHDIDSSHVAAMVAKRRGEFVPSQRKPGRKYKSPEVRKRVSPATVNRTATQPLREVMLRARNVWNAKVRTIAWSEHLLPEPQERVREARPDEEGAVQGELERGYDEALAFAFKCGARRMEILGLEWPRVDFFSRQFTLIGKGGRARVVPMTEELYRLLWAQQGRHPHKVFTYAAARTVKFEGKLVTERGKRYPLTKSGLKSAARRAIARAGVPDFHFHDTRHTAATRVLRKSNLRVVQEMLGHADIATTTKYAHVMREDLRAAMEAASTPPTEPVQAPEERTRRA